MSEPTPTPIIVALEYWDLRALVRALIVAGYIAQGMEGGTALRLSEEIIDEVMESTSGTE